MSTLSDLRPGKQYHVTLQAVNNMGISRASEPIIVKTAEQGQNINVFYMVVHNKDVHIAICSLCTLSISKPSNVVAPSGPPINIRLMSPDSQTMNIQWQVCWTPGINTGSVHIGIPSRGEYF